ncbi:MAG: hypothetical protein PSV35_05230, partial [bacterium]|nr:hypothetical protein [bacterium]
PQQSIDNASNEFKNILANKGFLQVANFNSYEEAKNAFEQIQSDYRNSLNKTIDLLKGKVRCILYGKGKISDLTSSAKMHEYYVRGYMAIGWISNNPPAEVGPNVNHLAHFSFHAR